jgi:hypothetical protein
MLKQNVGSESKAMNASRLVFSRFISASYFAQRNTGFASRSVVFLVLCALCGPAFSNVRKTATDGRNDSSSSEK